MEMKKDSVIDPKIRNQIKDNVLLNTQDAAIMLGVSEIAMKKWRQNKTVNIPFIKLGSLVRYRLFDIKRFIRMRFKKQMQKQVLENKSVQENQNVQANDESIQNQLAQENQIQ